MTPLALVAAAGEHPELHRIHAELLPSAGTRRSATDVEAVRRALAMARQQRAKSWELENPREPPRAAAHIGQA